MNRYDFALGRKPEIVFNSKLKKSVPKTLNEAVDYIIEEFMTHMATDYILENPGPAMAHITLFTNLRAMHMSGDMTEQKFLSQYQGVARKIKHNWNLDELSSIVYGFKRLNIHDADTICNMILVLVYRKIVGIKNGICHTIKNPCPNSKLNDGSFGLNSECGMGLC